MTRPADVTWVRGQVSDPDGTPIAGATVYCHAYYHGGIRMYSETYVTTTGDDGRYRFEGQPGLSSFEGTVIAHTDGRPPAVRQFRLRGKHDGQLGREVPASDVVRDLVLASGGYDAEVLALSHDGQPLPDVAVELAHPAFGGVLNRG
ncbi:MAG: carboxypeptidase-like regulatory domain-containing protein, partial [Planctomycetota bacterium]